MNSNRYDSMKYNRTGNSGLLLPAISLGLWNNFGSVDVYDNMVEMAKTAFNLGITHFDLANNYGPYPGSAEENFGRMLKTTFDGYRDELVISSKAGYRMWAGPYGEWGSRKYLISSLDQSLKRMGLEYVDIFYSHRFDPNTPLEETMGALDSIVKQGKALYIGISSYNVEQTEEACTILKNLGTPCLIHQPNYNMLNRTLENGLSNLLEKKGVGTIAFCPLAQGLLTDKYLNEIPADSRIAKPTGTLNASAVTPQTIEKLNKLNIIAQQRGQSLAQMALVWALEVGNLTSVLIGASKPKQIIENVKALDNLQFTKQELSEIEEILK